MNIINKIFKSRNVCKHDWVVIDRDLLSKDDEDMWASEVGWGVHRVQRALVKYYIAASKAEDRVCLKCHEIQRIKSDKIRIYLDKERQRKDGNKKRKEMAEAIVKDKEIKL